MSGEPDQHRRFLYSMLIGCILIIEEITYGLVHFGMISTASTTPCCKQSPSTITQLQQTDTAAVDLYCVDYFVDYVQNTRYRLYNIYYDPVASLLNSLYNNDVIVDYTKFMILCHYLFFNVYFITPQCSLFILLLSQ